MSPLEEDDFVLADLDSLGDPAELHAQARALIPPDGPAVTPPARQEGTDATEAVTVVVDAGGQVQGVTIDPRWRDRLDSAGLADALYEAYVAAAQKALTATAVATISAPGAPGDRRRSGDADGGTAAPEPAGPQDWLTVTRRRLDDLFGELERLEEAEAAARARIGGERTVSSPHGCLTLRLWEGGVVGATGDAERIRLRDAEELREEAVAVFRAASEVGGRRRIMTGDER